MSTTCVVKNVSAGTDLTAVIAAVASNNGKLCSPADCLEVFAEFYSAADLTQFEVDIAGIGSGYVASDWDIYPLLKQTKTVFV